MGDASGAALTATAIVASENHFHRSGPLWSLEDVEIARTLHEHELLIEMVATGICHFDVEATSVPSGTAGIQYPKIVGHEGAGFVLKVGSAVTVAKRGDPVLLSFSYCGNCDFCKSDRPSYCVHYAENVAGPTDVFKDIAGEEQGQFFGQSSFSSMSIVKENSVVNVKGLIKQEDDLKLFAPMGCGLQTGAGAVTILGNAGPVDVVVVTGLDAVGLGAVMAAKIAGCQTVIGVDKIESRLDLAKTLGAHAVVDITKFETAENLAEELVKAAKGSPISLVIDASGSTPTITAGLTCLGKRGRYIQVGVPPSDFQLTISMAKFFANSNMLMGCVMGDAVPRTFIPEMIQWYRDGKFPIDKIITYMPIKDFARGLKGIESGEMIKPVLIW